MDSVGCLMLKLSNRLQTIAGYVTAGSRIADIGSDHAQLPVYLLQAGIVPSAIAGELNKGPYDAARRQGAAVGLLHKLDVRQGDGLSVIQPLEVDTVTIAGMGGALMSDILEAGYQAGKLEGVKELVLQPNVGEDRVRSWLLEHGWLLLAETIMEEDEKIYEVLHAQKQGGQESKEHNAKVYDTSLLPDSLPEEIRLALLVRMGPFLLRKPIPVFHQKWQAELEKLERVCQSLSLSEQPEAAGKLAQLRHEMTIMKEVLACLPMDTPSSK